MSRQDDDDNHRLRVTKNKRLHNKMYKKQKWKRKQKQKKEKWQGNARWGEKEAKTVNDTQTVRKYWKDVTEGHALAMVFHYKTHKEAQG